MKKIRRNTRLQGFVLACLLPAMSLAPFTAYANPSGAKFDPGSIQIDVDGDTMNILQSKSHAIINWDSFSIATGERTIFQMPTGGANLSRVTGGSMSDIQGMLKANGNLFLINPNGILFGGGAVIDVNGMVASTLDITDEDFLNGGSYRLAGDSLASVVNLGKITVADGGEVVLAAHDIRNEGLILGGVDSRVVMISAHEALVTPGAKGNIIVSGAPAGSIVNTGKVEAGEIHFEAQSVYAAAIQNKGQLRANKASVEGGRVLLKVGGGGGIENAPGAVVEASNGVKGGEIVINTAGLFNNSGEMSAVGSSTGGSVSVTAGEVALNPGSLLDASGGVGGSVVVSTNGAVNVSGEINAGGAVGRGGAVSMSAGEVSIGQSGVVDVSGATEGGIAALSAAGGVKIDGSIVADGGSAKGGLIKVSASEVVTAGTSTISADGAKGGTVALDASGINRATGDVTAIGATGKGGQITLTGNSVTLQPGALVDASGVDGGDIFIGGNFQGNGALRESIFTSAAAGSEVRAIGNGGNGGNVVFWSNGVMDFAGNIDATGQVNGGLVEVSGLQSLGFSGTVDTSGITGRTGTLLLDPNNVILGTGGITQGALAIAITLNNVVIHTDNGSALGTGNITVQDGFDLRYNSANSLSLFAHDDIFVGGIIKNHGSGNVNLFAGWNGTGAGSFTPAGLLGANTYDSPGAIGIADLVGNTALYGAFGSGGSGSITFNPNSNSLVNVGSAGGQTNILAHSILLNTGDQEGEFTQVGYRPEEAFGAYVNGGIFAVTETGVSPTGDINVHANSNVILLSNSNGRYTQIGHGGMNQDDRMNGADPWQIEVPDVDLAGNITVRAGGALILSGGSTDGGYSMIGHGGFADDNVATTNVARDTRDFRRIDANARGNISVETLFLQMQSSGVRSHTQIGHGGYSVHGEHTGHINVLAQFGINASAGGAGQTDSNFDDSYVMIGHGGGGARDSGTSVASLQQAERGAEHQYTLPRDLDGTKGILPGPDGLMGTADDIGEGILTVDVVNTLIATNGAGTPWASGNGTGAALTAGTYNMSFLPETGISATTGGFRKVGFAGNITVSSPQGSISFNAGGVRAFAQIGHGGYFTAGEMGGWDMDNADGDNDWATGQDGDITVNALGDIKFDRVIRGQNASGQLQFAGNTQAHGMIGHGGYQSSGGFHGNISVTAQTGTVEFYGGRGESFVQIGHGGRMESDGPDNTFGANLRSHPDDFAQGTHSGNITVNAGSDIIFRSGFGQASLAYSQIGHGGYRNYALAREGFNGNIVINSGGNIDFLAGPRAGELRPGQFQDENNINDTYTMIGHGGRDAKGDHWGSITVTAAGDISIEAKGGYNAVGYQDNAATTNPNPPNLFNENGDTIITGTAAGEDESGIPTYSGGQNSGVTGDRNFAQIGHGGYDADHTLGTSGDLVLTTGSNSVGFGILGLIAGHRADGTTLAVGADRVESNISITAGGDFNLVSPQRAGLGVQNSAFLSYDADGPTGTSDVAFVDPITLLALPGAVELARDSWAQVGHGGRSSEIRTGVTLSGLSAGHYGNISVGAGGDVNVIASDIIRAHEAGTIGSPNTWVIGDSTGNAEYYDLPFWLDGQDGIIDGIDASNRNNQASIPGWAPVNLATVFPLYNFVFAQNQMAIDAQDGILTLGQFNFTRSSGPDMIFGTGDDVLTGGTTDMSVSLESNNGWAQIGHGGFDSTEGAMKGNIDVTSTGGGLNVIGGNNVRAFAHIGHGGDDGTLDRDQPVEGHITVDVDGDINVTGGDRTFGWAMIGHGGHQFTSTTGIFSTRNANINVTTHNGDLNLTGGDFNARDVNGTTIVNNFAQFAKIGHGGWDSDMDLAGDIAVMVANGSINMTGTKARGNFTQIGHGAQFMDGGPLQGSAMAGNITVDAFGGINLRGGDAPTYTDLIAANRDPEGQAIFPVNFYPENEFSAIGSAQGQYAYSMIGHGGSVLGTTTPRGVTISGNIAVNTATMDRDPNASITLQAGDGDGNFALIGHGGTRMNSTESITGDVTVNSQEDILLTGGPRLYNNAATGSGAPGNGLMYNAENFAQIGHYVGAANVAVNLRSGNTSGNVSVTALDDIILQAGGGAAAHAKIGHGSNLNYLLKNANPGLLNQQGDHLGNITVVTGGDLSLLGATPFQNDSSTQNQFGIFDPTLGTLLPGGLMSFAQIGNGGAGVTSNAGGLAGAIDVRVGGNLTMTSGQTRNGYSKIGHGDYMFTNSSLSGGGFRDGNISVAVGNNATLTGAQIGHVDDGVSNAVAIAGNTYVAVGRNINNPGGTLRVQALAANPAAGFATAEESSISSGFTGELRLYMATRVQNMLATNTLLNDSSYIYPAVPPLRMDEANASEFGFTYVDGLPTGSFTPNGTYTETALGRYTIFYGPVIGGSLPPVNPGPVTPGGGGDGGTGGGDNGGGEVPPPVTPGVPLPPIPGLPPTVPTGGLTPLQIALINAYFGGNVPAELAFLMDPNYQNTTGVVNTGYTTESQFTVTSAPGSVAGGTPADGTITIYGTDSGAQGAGTFDNSEEERRRRSGQGGSAPAATDPFAPENSSQPGGATPPAENPAGAADDMGFGTPAGGAATPPADGATPPAPGMNADPFSFQ